MKSVLLSVQPKWCREICKEIGKNDDGKPVYKKDTEVRKNRPNLATPFKVYIYCTKGTGKNTFCVPITYEKMKEHYEQTGSMVCSNNPIGNGMVIGEFICDKITVAECGNYTALTKLRTMLDEFEILDYADEKTIYGWHISELIIYDEPKDLKNYKQCFKCDFRQICVEGADCYDEEGLYTLTRPPQSWCYVEVLR